MKTVQQIIKELRKLGYTQTRIAAYINAPQARISRWESGVSPVLNDALKLRDLLELESPQIFNKLNQ